MDLQQNQDPQNQNPTPPEPQSNPNTTVPAPSNSKHTPRIAIIGLLLAVVIAPVGLITSILAWRKIKKYSLGGKWLAITGTVLGALLILPFILFAWLFIALGAWHGNQAQKDFDPIARQIVDMGGTKLCNNGDSGYGIDNTTPWYQVYYTVPNTSDLTSEVKNIASQQEYQLSTDTNFINQLKGLPEQRGELEGVYVTPYGDEQFNPKSDYLIGQSGNKSLKVTINRQTSVALYCGVEDYGKKQPTGSNAILDFSLTLPDRNL